MGKNGKTVSESQKRATAKYESANYDKVLLRMKKGVKDEILSAIGEDGSVNGFINQAIAEKLASLNK